MMLEWDECRSVRVALRGREDLSVLELALELAVAVDALVVLKLLLDPLCDVCCWLDSNLLVYCVTLA